jgi:RNA polymerase sigma factor for flagellar operon FliA
VTKTEVRDQLVIENIGVVKAIAIRVHENLPVHVDLDDLIQAGTIGLIEVASKFDSKRKVPFPLYARHRIKGAILDALRRLDFASRDDRRHLKKAAAATTELTAELGRAPSDEELAKKLGMELTEWRKRCVHLRSIGTISASTRKDDNDIPAPDFACAPAHQPDRMCLEQETRDQLTAALRVLTPRYRKVMELYYQKDLTMREIGLILGVNEARVCQIHKAALAKLREKFESSGVTSIKAFAAGA